MSGGYFDYEQYRMHDIAQKIIELINSDRGYSEKTIEEFGNAVHFLKVAEAYAQRIDWLASDDDGEETFHERLKQDLEAIE